MESEIVVKVLGNLTDKTLEGLLADKQVSGFLATMDLTKSNSSRPVAVELLDTSSGRTCRLAGGLGGKLLRGGIASGGMAGCLLRACHYGNIIVNTRYCCCYCPCMLY